VNTSLARTLESAALADAERALTSLGFRKRAGQIYTAPLRPRILGWLGLSHVIERGSVAVSVAPNVGVHHHDIERVVATLLDRRPLAYEPPTVATNIGYLTPRHRYAEWTIEDETQIQPAMHELAETVRDAGLPFMTSNVELPILLDTLRHPSLGGPGYLVSYRVPVCLVLMGRRDEANAALAECLSSMGQRTDAAAASYRRFAAAFAATYK
jgi:hypothetical protein